MDKSPSSLLDPEAINRVESLGLHARFVVEGHMAGEHPSPYHGFAVEFAWHRPYVPGDDVRHLDWKVLGRTERFYIKQYEQETNYTAHVLLDGSLSMQYGSGPRIKLHYAKMMAACLGYLILGQRDAAAVRVFDESAHDTAPPGLKRGAFHQLLTQLADFVPSGKTNLPAVLHQLAAKARRKGLVIVISDLFDDEAGILNGLQHLRFGGHEVIVFHVLDPFELEFPFAGQIEFDGLEGEGKLMARPVEIRSSYLRELEEFRRRIREGCERNQCHYMLVNTAHPLSETLGGYLAFRRRTSAR